MRTSELLAQLFAQSSWPDRERKRVASIREALEERDILVAEEREEQMRYDLVSPPVEAIEAQSERVKRLSEASVDQA